MTLKAKITSSQVALVAVAVAATASVAVWQSHLGFTRIGDAVQQSFGESTSKAHDALLEAAMGSINQQAAQILSSCATQDEVVRNTLDAYLAVAHATLVRAGTLGASTSNVPWSAVNQLNDAKQDIQLPQLTLGGQWIGQNFDANVPSPVVDEVSTTLGCTCTLFQRMNEQGDMLRAATSVKRSDGTRAIGTFVPAVDPDGKPNPVVSVVMKGERYCGRARVVDKWYFTTYEPLKDGAGQLVGMLYVGIPEQFAASLRTSIISQKVGKTGYVYVIKGTGESRGQYIVSKDGKRDGENIWETKDANGNFVIQQICAKAITLAPGELAEFRYFWKNADDPAPREKVVKLAYYAPWDWVIGVGTYLDEISVVADDMRARGEQAITALRQTGDGAQRSAATASLAVGGGVLLAALCAALWIGRSIAVPLRRAIDHLSHGATQVNDAAGQIASASQSLASSTSEQASSLQESSAALEQLTAMTKQSAASAGQASTVVIEARSAADSGAAVVQELNAAMDGVSQAGEQIRRILKVIEEIAFQTNLLALNAAVEAARAGEHGRGFAVVADEVRKLAQRAASAAGEIGELVENTSERSRAGVRIAADVGQVLVGILDNVKQVSSLVEGIAASTREQAQGVEQISTAVSQMDRVTQQNAASAEQSASASEELASQAVAVTALVGEMTALVTGRKVAAASAK